MEPGQVPLDAVIIQIAEESNARFIIGKKEPAKVAGESLNAGSDRNEVKIWRLP